jgi:hypothetical protein
MEIYEVLEPICLKAEAGEGNAKKGLLLLNEMFRLLALMRELMSQLGRREDESVHMRSLVKQYYDLWLDKVSALGCGDIGEYLNWPNHYG